MLLAVERSSATAAAAVFQGDGRLLAMVEAAGAGAGDAYPLVRDVLAKAGVSPADLAAFAVRFDD